MCIDLGEVYRTHTVHRYCPGWYRRAPVQDGCVQVLCLDGWGYTGAGHADNGVLVRYDDGCEYVLAVEYLMPLAQEEA